MNTFVLWLENWGDETPEINGEYWIEENGGTLFADGDVGDMNHDGFVIQHVCHQIADKFGIHFDDQTDWEETKKEIAGKIFEEELEKAAGDHAKVAQLHSEWEDGEYDVFYDAGCDEQKIDHEERQIADGNGDPRTYAMEKWGWKRVAGHNVETWTFTPNDIDVILTGLYDIIQEGDEEQIKKVEVYIYVYANQQSHDLTIGQLDAMVGKANQPPPLAAPHHVAQTQPVVDPTERIKQLARDRNDATIDYNSQGLKQAGDANQTAQSKGLIHPYYQQKKFPFADWAFRNHGILLTN